MSGPDDRISERNVFSATNPIRFSLEPLPPADILERLWRKLELVAEPSFFTSWYWIGSLVAALPPVARPMLLRGSIADRTVALGLLSSKLVRRRYGLIKSRSLYLNDLSDPEYYLMTEHNGLLVAAGHEENAFGGLIKFFADHSTIADELHVRGSTYHFPEAYINQYSLYRTEISVPYYYLDLSCLSCSGGELYSILSANARQQLRRSIRRFEQAGTLDLVPATTLDEAYGYFYRMKDLHCDYWSKRGKEHAFSKRFFEHFHCCLMERSFPDGVVELLRASAGPRVIGYLYNFRFRNRVYAYQSGFAYDRPNARPGVVTHALAIGHAYRSGAAFYDFLAGQNRLKGAFSTHCGTMYWTTIQQPRLCFRFENLARDVKHLLTGRAVAERDKKPCQDENKYVRPFAPPLPRAGAHN